MGEAVRSMEHVEEWKTNGFVRAYGAHGKNNYSFVSRVSGEQIRLLILIEIRLLNTDRKK